MDSAGKDIHQMQTDIIRSVLNLDVKGLSQVRTLITMIENGNTSDDVEIEGFKFSDKPQTREEIIAELDEIVEDVKRGNFVTFEDLIKQTEEKIANHECCLV